MTTQQHLWSMTAIISTLLAGNMAVQMVNAQEESPAPKVVVAQEFRLVNVRNQTLATMAIGLDGGPQISLFDGRSDPYVSREKRLELSVDGYGQPNLQFNDPSGKPRLKMNFTEYRGNDSAPVISILDYQNRARATLRINANNQADLSFSNDKGGRAVLKTESLSMRTNIEKDSTQTSLFAFDGKNSGLVFADESGKWLWTAPPKKAAFRKKRSTR